MMGSLFTDVVKISDVKTILHQRKKPEFYQWEWVLSAACLSSSNGRYLNYFVLTKSTVFLNYGNML